MQEQILYYQKRAKEYELIYQKPERQKDLSLIKEYLEKQFIDKTIIEIACGTGYWTEVLSKPSKSILATDINPKVLQIAQNKKYLKQNITFEIKDIEDLKYVSGNFEGLFGGFIWSHIRKEDIEDFLKMALNQVKEGAEIVFLDNKFIAGSSTPIIKIDDNGNTFQIRELMSGEKFEILKNFPHPDEMKGLIDKVGNDFEWLDFDYYWIIKFIKRKTS